MFAGLLELILHPDKFFARVSREKIDLVPPLLIVGAGMFIIFLTLFIPICIFPDTLPGPYGIYRIHGTTPGFSFVTPACCL